MRFASALSREPDADRAIGLVADALRERLGGALPDLLCVFASVHFSAAYPQLGKRFASAFPNALLFGCGAHSVIGGGHEAEDGPAIAAAAAALPGVTLHPFYLGDAHLPSLSLPADAHVLLLADPFSSPLSRLLPQLDARFPGGVKLGGVASGAQQPSGSALFLADGLARSGVIAVALHGDLALDTVVAQGCRPVGQPMFVTSASDDLLCCLDARTPMAVLRELFDAAPPEDQRLYQHSLFLGIEMRPGESRYGVGDYLIRNLLGSNDEGALRVAADLNECRVVQFHLRDAKAASGDLARQLARYAAQHRQPAGALLFSCLGRGRGLYGMADHDSRVFEAALGPVPLGGFFANGEIGPVESQTFLHGYTSAFGMFRPLGRV